MFPRSLPRSEKLPVGVSAVITACLLNVVVGASFYFARQNEPSFSPLTGVFLRVLANFSCLLLPALGREARPKLRPQRGHAALWLWGLLGAVSTGSYFLAISSAPVGLVNFLNSGSGIFIAALAPLLAGQATSGAEWVGIFGSMLGIFLLSDPAGASGVSPLGPALALLSGLACAGAYLMVARTRGRPYGTSCLILHWSVVNFVVYGGLVLALPLTWPHRFATWAALLVAGLGAAWSQWFTARAFRLAPAALVACLSYLGTVLSVATDTFVFRVHYRPLALVGASIVLCFGCGFPLWRHVRRATPSEAPVPVTKLA